MSDYLTDAQLEAHADDIRYVELIGWDRDPERSYRVLDQARQVLTAFEAERQAHQATQAELEAARNEIDARRTRDELTVTGETWESLRQSFEVDSAIDAYDAARAKEDAE